MAAFKSAQANQAIIGIYTLLMSVFIFSILYFGQGIFIPLILATLLTFLLAPIVTSIERWVGRIPAILIVVIIIFFFTSVTGYILSIEFSDLMNSLPNYKGNIETKLSTFGFIPKDFFSTMWTKIGSSTTAKLPANLVDTSTITDTAQFVISTLVHIIINIGFVMLLVIFMLLNREDLKGRIIRLIGKGNIPATTLAMDDVGNRIFHYLFMQLIINFCFGFILTIGLYLIGIPNAALWGVLLMVLRFIPYIGTWISAAIPVLLSFVISASWITPLLTIGLYLALDLICTNFLEPWLYGTSTGISSTALIIAAVFWTLLWGPIGLLLAIPLTVCLVVIGRHVRQLEFLGILLGDNKALEVHEEYYHRLLTKNQSDGMILVEKFIKENSVLSLYDSVLIPLLIKMERDLHIGYLESEKAQYLYQCIQDIIEDQNESTTLVPTKIVPTELENLTPKTYHYVSVLCLPVRALRDEIARQMLVQVLQNQSFKAENLSIQFTSEQLLERVKKNDVNIICIAVIYPSSLLHVRFLTKKLRALGLDVKILVCLFGAKKSDIDDDEMLRSIKAEAITTQSSTVNMLKEKNVYEDQMKRETEALKIITNWRNTLPQAVNNMTVSIKNNKIDEARIYLMQNLQPRFKQVTEALKTLANLQAEQSKLSVEVSEATTKKVIVQLIIVILVSLFLGTLFFYLLTRSIVRPIQNLLNAARSISETGNLQQVIDLTSEDEIGKLAQAFKNMTFYLQEMANISDKFSEGDLTQTINIRSDKDTFGKSFQKMALYLQEMASVSGKIAQGDLTQNIAVRSDKDAFGLSFRNMLNGLKKLITETLGVADNVLVSSQQLSSSAQQMSAATQEIAASVQQIVSGSQNQADQVEQTTQAINQINKNVDQVANGAQASAATSVQATQVAERGNELMKDTLQKINKIFDTVLNSAKVVQTLGDRSEQIGGIVEVITRIADQTSLLALNATIEAARAGEAGRGFAVVADEVRKLAEGSAKAAEQISGLIKGIQKETGEAVVSMEVGSAEVKEGRVVAEKASLALEEIINTVKMTATSIQLIADSSQEMVAGTQQVVNSIDKVAASAEQAASGAEQVGASTQEMSASMQQIAASSEDLSEMASTLRETVRMFKVDVNVDYSDVTSSAPAKPKKSLQKSRHPTSFKDKTHRHVVIHKPKPDALNE